MPNYEVIISNTYRVTADSPEQALGSWRVRFDGVAMVSVGLGPDQVLSQDDFEFIDGKGEAIEV